MARVTVILRGGLGNQMFEYAAGLNLALKSGAKLMLDTTYLNDRFPRPQITHRDYDLDVFALKPEFTALSKISSAVPIPGFWLGLDLISFFVKKILKVKQNPVLWGFYAGEKYFAENENAIRAAFRFRESLTGEAASVAKKIKEENSIAIHVRRGDYTLPRYEKLYGKTNVSYYEQAIAHMEEKVSNPKFFIFSNDIAWCRENIKPKSPTVYLDDATSGPKGSFHLHLMSLCKHAILANSSFSWWAAWLNVNPEKIVVAPKRWHLDTSTESNDIVPSKWITI